jgi:hypothetical protein
MLLRTRMARTAGNRGAAGAGEVLPSGLLRFWLQWHYQHSRLNVPGFAREIKATPAAVHNWISGERGTRRGISEKFWPRIARFFQFATPEELLAAARALHVGTNGVPSRELPLTHPATPSLVREFLRDSARATGSRPPPQPARSAAARKTHETP